MTDEGPLSKLEHDHLLKIKNLIDDILQARDRKEGRTAYVHEVFVPAHANRNELGLTYIVTIKDPKEIMIHVLQLDMLREEPKRELGIVLSSISPVDRYTIELIFKSKSISIS